MLVRTLTALMKERDTIHILATHRRPVAGGEAGQVVAGTLLVEAVATEAAAGLVFVVFVGAKLEAVMDRRSTIMVTGLSRWTRQTHTHCLCYVRGRVTRLPATTDRRLAVVRKNKAMSA